jgi:hypothetical protein
MGSDPKCQVSGSDSIFTCAPERKIT